MLPAGASPARSPSPWPRRIRRGIAILAIVYAIVVAVMLLNEDRLVFHPNAHGGYWLPPPRTLDVEEVWLEATDGTPIHAWWCPHPGAKGAVLFCHGNAGNLSHRGPEVEVIRDALGESVLIFDYPGYGKSAGTPSERGCYAAAEGAYEWLRLRVPAERIILFGQSLGGGVVVDLASHKPHRVLALFKTFTSVPDVAAREFPFLPVRWLARNRFDNLAKIEHCTAPTFIAHGDCDRLIPLEQAETLYQAAPGPKRFYLMKGCGHPGGASAAYLAELRAFLDQ